MVKWLIAVGVVVIVIAAGFLLLGKGNKTSAPTVMQEAPTAMPSEASQTTATTAAQEVTVEGTEFAFSPNTITAMVNKPLKITFKNNGTFPHNLTIVDLNAKSATVQPGQSDTFVVTPTKTGSFEFKCTVDSHAEKGMVGTLTVN